MNRDETWGRKVAITLLSRSAKYLESEARDHERWHTLQFRPVAALALLANSSAVTDQIASLIRDAPAHAFTDGIISNFDVSALSAKRDAIVYEEADERFPEYAATDLPHVVVQFAALPHIASVLAGRVEDAIGAANSDLLIEEVASMCAVVGRIDTCLEILDRPDFPRERADRPRMVACIESFRRGDATRAQHLLDQVAGPGAEGWDLIFLTAGLIGREPWDGYPFPDY